MNKNAPILITGASGFIGGWLVRYLHENGYTNIRAVASRPKNMWYQICSGAENIVCDLRLKENCSTVMQNMDYVFNLSATFGGIKYISSQKANCMLSVLINTHLLEAAKEQGVKRYFFSSSACIYPCDGSIDRDFKEEDAYPAMPIDGYGWEKLFSERMCQHYCTDFGVETRIGRFHTVYGPHDAYDGGKEKVIAALCRKVILAKLSGNNAIEIWGDGEQTRSFMYIDDCILGVLKLVDSTYPGPMNIGSSEKVTINQLLDIIEEVADIKVKRNYDISGPQGIRGRNSNNDLIKKELGWEPVISLKEGVAKTYLWIYEQISTKHYGRAP